MTDTQPIGQTATPDWDHWLAQPSLRVDIAAWISLNINPSLVTCRYIAEKYMDYYRTGEEHQLPSDSELHCLHEACTAQKDEIFGSMFFPDSDAERYYRRLFNPPDRGAGSSLSEEFSFRLSFLFGPKRCPSLADKVRGSTISLQDFAALCVAKRWMIPWRLAERGGIRRALEPRDIGLALRRELWTLRETADYLCGYAPYPEDRTEFPSPTTDKDLSEMERRITDAIDVGTLASFRDGTGFRPQDVAAWATTQSCCPAWLTQSETANTANAKLPKRRDVRKTETLPTIILALAKRTDRKVPPDIDDFDKSGQMDLVMDLCDKAGINFCAQGAAKELHRIVFPGGSHEIFKLRTTQSTLKQIKEHSQKLRAAAKTQERK